MDYFEVAKGITSNYAERLAKDDLIRRQSDVIETLQNIVKVQGEKLELLEKAMQA